MNLTGEDSLQLQVEDFPTGSGEEEKNLGPLLLDKDNVPKQGPDLRGKVLAPHSGEGALVLGFQPQCRFQSPTGSVGGVQDRPERTMEILELTAHVHRGPMPSPILYPTWNIELQE